jgi:UDP-glucuronate decarboxylase
MKTALVTGGAGFLGSNLCARLLKQSYKVLCLDNLYTGRKKNITKFLNSSNFKFIEQDVRDVINFDEKLDVIFNLACPASPPAYQARPIFTTTTCVNGALNMIELSKKHGAILFHASTSEVYGDPEVTPQNEEYNGNVNPNGVRSCYDEGKRCAESLLFDAKRLYNINIKVARIFNTYGPNMDPNDGRVVTNFIRQALYNDPITIYGDGKQTRCFCYVDDQIEGWMRLINQDKDFAGPINIGSTKELSILEFAELVIDLTKSKSKIVFQEAKSDDPRRRLPDTTLAKNVLKWDTEISLEDGLNKTINYFKKEI